MKVLISTSSFGKYDDSPLRRLNREKFDIIINPYGRSLSEEESCDLYSPEISGVIAGTEKITGVLLNKAKNLRVISRCGIGLDNIDLESVRKYKIRVFNTPGPVVDAVAELTLGLILNCLRNITFADKNVCRNIWNKDMGFLLKDKKLGIVGLGNIGKRVVELCSVFRVKVFAYDQNTDQKFANKYGIDYVALDVLLSKSDIVSIHLPLTGKTRYLFDHETLNRMKKNSFLINTSRGGIIDENALVKVLGQQKIAGAALDVFEKEPYQGPLSELENVILTPHIGSYARESRIKMEIQAADNLIKGLKGG